MDLFFSYVGWVRSLISTGNASTDQTVNEIDRVVNDSMKLVFAELGLKDLLSALLVCRRWRLLSAESIHCFQARFKIIRAFLAIYASTNKESHPSKPIMELFNQAKKGPKKSWAFALLRSMAEVESPHWKSMFAFKPKYFFNLWDYQPNHVAQRLGPPYDPYLAECLKDLMDAEPYRITMLEIDQNTLYWRDILKNYFTSLPHSVKGPVRLGLTLPFEQTVEKLRQADSTLSSLPLADLKSFELIFRGKKLDQLDFLPLEFLKNAKNLQTLTIDVYQVRLSLQAYDQIAQWLISREPLKTLILRLDNEWKYVDFEPLLKKLADLSNPCALRILLSKPWESIEVDLIKKRHPDLDLEIFCTRWSFRHFPN